MQENKKLYGKENKPRIIGYGIYKDVKWAITSVNGKHPCAYIEDKFTTVYDDMYKIPLDVHGGITFYDYCHFNPEEENVKYIGWDYAHCGDYIDHYNLPEQFKGIFKFDGDRKYTYDEIKDEILKAIDKMIEVNKYENN